ncbi:MAG: transglycosylase SLT domain-containing protein [Rhodanobacter sp.]
MLPGMEMLACPNLAVSPQVMQHIVQVESGANPYAIGVVGGKLARQPRNMDEALSTARMLENEGYNFSVGIAQVNRANLGRYGLDSYRKAFTACDNLAAGARILARCRDSAHGDWGKAFSCYYSGNFTTGFRDGYVQKVYASMKGTTAAARAVTTPMGDVATTAPSGTPSTVEATAGGRVMPPLVVHSGENADYRIAMRSLPMVAVAPAAASRPGSPPPGNDSDERALARAPLPASAIATPGVPDRPPRDDTAASSPTAPNRQPVPPGFAGTTVDGVFEPRVRGPGEPVAPATPAARASIPWRDHADLRTEHHDAAFVF